MDLSPSKSTKCDAFEFTSVNLDQTEIASQEPSSDYSLNQHSAEEKCSYRDMNGQFHDENFSNSNAASQSSSNFPTNYRTLKPDLSKVAALSTNLLTSLTPTVEKLKSWGRSNYICTKQSLFEKLGRSPRTIDIELEAKIEHFKEGKRRYESFAGLAQSYASNLSNLLITQRALTNLFVELKDDSLALSDEFTYNAENQRNMVQNGEILLSALNFFIANLQTLCKKSMEDTMTTVRDYETSRLEYDAARRALGFLPVGHQFDMKEQEVQIAKNKYEKLRADATIKIQLMEENQIHVMKSQLLLFHNAIVAYFSGNKDGLEATMKQYHIKIERHGDAYYNRDSFIERLVKH